MTTVKPSRALGQRYSGPCLTSAVAGASARSSFGRPDPVLGAAVLVAAAPPRPKAPETKTAAPKTAAPKTGSGRTKEDRADAPATALVKQGPLYRWPSTLKGFTVVINSTEDRGSATTFARSASKAKPAKLGVIRADDFKTLPQGFFVVFAGFYEDRGKADQATERLNRRYPGSFTQAVER